MQKRTWESMCWTSLYFINLIIRTKKLAQNCFLNMMHNATMNSHQVLLQKYFGSFANVGVGENNAVSGRIKCVQHSEKFS